MAETDEKKRNSSSSDSDFQLPEHPLESLNSIKPEVGSDSSLEGEELRGTNDLDLVGACRTLDHLFIQQRKEVNQLMSNIQVTSLKNQSSGGEETSAFRKINRYPECLSPVKSVEHDTGNKMMSVPQLKRNSAPPTSFKKPLAHDNKKTLPRIVQVIKKEPAQFIQEDLTSLIVSDHVKTQNYFTKSGDNDLTSLVIRDHVTTQNTVIKPQESIVTTQANMTSTRLKQKQVDSKKLVASVSKSVRIVSEQRKEGFRVKTSDKKVVISDSTIEPTSSISSGSTLNTMSLTNSDSQEVGASSLSHVPNQNVDSIPKKKITPQQAGKISLTWALTEQNSVEDNTQLQTEPSVKTGCAPTTNESAQATNKVNKSFGYNIHDVDAFLSEGSLRNPANIPMVLSARCTLYQTTHGRQSATILPLGMVVSAIFKNHDWLYVHTPHGEEGYVAYQACLPLGILPKRKDTNNSNPPAPWEIQDDLFGSSSRTRVGSSAVYNVTIPSSNRNHREGLTEIMGSSPRRYIFPTTELESTVHREISETFLNKTDSEKLYENFATTAPRSGRTRRRKQCRTSNNIETLIANRQSRAKTRSLSANRITDRNHSSRPRSPTRDLSVDRLRLSDVETPLRGREAPEHTGRNMIGRSLPSLRTHVPGVLDSHSGTRFQSNFRNNSTSPQTSLLNTTSGDYASLEPRPPSPRHHLSRTTNSSTSPQ